MDNARIVAAMAAAAHRTRLDVLLLLSKDGGISAGEIARRLDVVQNTLSAHIARLVDAGLVEVRRAGTTKFYSIDRGGTAAIAKMIGGL